MFYFSTVQQFHPDYGLLLELHALTLVGCSYALLAIINWSMGKLENKARDELHTYTSLVSRLPCSRTQTLKLCGSGEPGIFSHVRSGNGRHEVDATIIVRGHM